MGTLMGQPDVGDVHVPKPTRSMPYQSEHASRQRDPGDYARFRRKTLAPGVDAVIGFREEGGSEIQSLRFDAEQFSPAEAKAWLKDHDFKMMLEAATSKHADLDLLIVEKADEKRFVLGVVYAPGSPQDTDTQEEFAKADTIEAAAWTYMQRLQKDAGTLYTILRAAVRADDDGVMLDVTDAIEKAQALDDQHEQTDEEIGTVVESYIAPTDFEIKGQSIKKGTWLLGAILTPEYFKLVKTGKRTGFSMFGTAERREVSVA